MISKYYVFSFFWSTVNKLINAIVGFVSVPLLLRYFGIEQYGIITLATAANAYMAILDMGTNVGAVKYYSQWRVEGKLELIETVSRTNTTVYIFIGIINTLVLLLLAFFGNHIFTLTVAQFLNLKKIFSILAMFSLFNWISISFNQLLVSDNDISFVQQAQALSAFSRIGVIGLTLVLNMSISTYFSLWTLTTAVLIFPYAWRCIKRKIVKNILPGWDWGKYRVIFIYSLSIFALSFFQMTATNSRPMILGIFSSEGVKVVAEYRMIEVFPVFILSVGGILTNILLPRAAEVITKKDQSGLDNIAYNGTVITTILANILCVPFVLCSKEIISVYIGSQYIYLSKWMIIWSLTILIQIHTTPCNSLILAKGKTLFLVVTTAIACIISICINALLCNKIGVGSAVLGYFIYVLIVISANYLFFYSKLLGLNRVKLSCAFFQPTFLSFVSMFITFVLTSKSIFQFEPKNIFVATGCCLVKIIIWVIIYSVFLLLFKVIDKRKLITCIR